MKATRIVSSLWLLLVMASGALGQKVYVGWERGANFLQYRTYAWGACDDLGELEVWRPVIVQNIEAQLAARGFRKAQPGQQPDVIVSYQGDVTERTSYVAYDYANRLNWGLVPALGRGPSWGWDWNAGPVTVEPVVQREFELTVELVDARRNQLFWRGDGADNLSHKSEKTVKRLRKTVEKLFRDYPYGD